MRGTNIQFPETVAISGSCLRMFLVSIFILDTTSTSVILEIGLNYVHSITRF